MERKMDVKRKILAFNPEPVYIKRHSKLRELVIKHVFQMVCWNYYLSIRRLK
jgi:hypothetical protein